MLQIRILILIMLTVVGTASQGLAMPGRLSGSIEYSYAQHTAEEGGTEVLDASHFAQIYSLMWEKDGVLNKGRLGKYDVALGYEWNWVESEINGSEVDIQNPLDKILFRGDLLIAPGGLPFRLNVYSYDTNSTSLNYRQLGELFVDQDYDRQDGIAASFQNGSEITTGLTLMAGVKNGQYGGRYRDLFTAMPRVLIDFKQSDIRDIKGPSPTYYTDRNLAFVSLNKNKNWFHYRFFTHEDKLNSDNDFQTQTYLLGTIDHVDRRQWVDLTNWIQVSTDVSFSETNPNPNASITREKRYDYNLFATAQRTDWKAGAYSSFSRIRDGRSLEKSVDIPIMASGRLNRETTWRIRLENQHGQEEIFDRELLEKESNMFLASRLDMFSQSRYMISPTLDLEYKDGSDSNGHALRAGVEAYNNQRYRTDTDLFGSYSLALFEGVSEAEETSSYWEQQLVGRFAKDLSSDLRTGFDQELTLGSGSYDNGATNYIEADVSVLPAQGGSGGIVEGTYYRSISRWFVDHRPASRIYNRFELSYDYINSSVGTGGQFAAVHSLNYYGRTVKASMNNELIFGDSLHESFNTDLDVVGGTTIARQGGTVSRSFESVGRLDYDPDRRHHNSLELELEWRGFDSGGSDQRYKFTQLYEYTFWKDRGLLRKIAVLGEEFEYEDYSQSFGASSSLSSFTLFTDLYPTRQTLLSARLRYEINSVKETDTMLVFLSASVDFSKFQLDLDYSYGTRSAGVLEPEREEHKWEMKVKKIF